MAAALEASVSLAPLNVGLEARYQASAARNVVSADDLDVFLVSLLRHAPNCSNEDEYVSLLAKAATGIDRARPPCASHGAVVAGVVWCQSSGERVRRRGK